MGWGRVRVHLECSNLVWRRIFWCLEKWHCLFAVVPSVGVVHLEKHKWMCEHEWMCEAYVTIFSTGIPPLVSPPAPTSGHLLHILVTSQRTAKFIIGPVITKPLKNPHSALARYHCKKFYPKCTLLLQHGRREGLMGFELISSHFLLRFMSFTSCIWPSEVITVLPSWLIDSVRHLILRIRHPLFSLIIGTESKK